jgi:hypothetical protein
VSRVGKLLLADVAFHHHLFFVHGDHVLLEHLPLGKPEKITNLTRSIDI